MSYPIVDRYNQWEAKELQLTQGEAQAIWIMLAGYRTLWSDALRGNARVWFNLLEDPGVIKLGVYKRDDSIPVGIIYFDFRAAADDAEAHIIFLDRKPIEKLDICKAVMQWLFDSQPKLASLVLRYLICTHKPGGLRSD